MYSTILSQTNQQRISIQMTKCMTERHITQCVSYITAQENKHKKERYLQCCPCNIPYILNNTFYQCTGV